MCMALGGRAAEALIFNKITTGRNELPATVDKPTIYSEIFKK